MAAYEQYLMFDSTDADPREYSAAQWAEYFAQILTDGLFGAADNLRVYATGDAQAVRVTSGYAWIHGYMYALKREVEGDSDFELALDSADAGSSRIDIIVLRLDTSVSERSIRLRVVKGVPAASPVAPALTRSGNVYELELAQVLVAANTAVIAAGNVTDMRNDASVCGPVNSLITLDPGVIMAALSEQLQDAIDATGVLTHTHAASDITAGTLAGQVKANKGAVATLTTGQVRNIILATSAPTAGISNGDIWLSYT